MLVFILTLTLAVMVVLCCGCMYFLSCCTEKELAFKLNDKCSLTRLDGSERVELCTTELVMFQVAMECHGNRFRTSIHSTVSLVTFKETLSKRTQMQPQDDIRGVHA